MQSARPFELRGSPFRLFVPALRAFADRRGATGVVQSSAPSVNRTSTACTCAQRRVAFLPGSDKVKAALEKEVKDRGLEHQCKVKGVGCMGLCANGPLVADKPRNVMYQNVTEDDAADIVKSLDAEPVARLECPTEMPFFRRQVKIVLENCGRIPPSRWRTTSRRAVMKRW